MLGIEAIHGKTSNGEQGNDQGGGDLFFVAQPKDVRFKRDVGRRG